MEYFADASSISCITFFFCHSQCYFYTARVPTNVGIMFHFSFVFCTFIKLFHKAEMPSGENFFKQKKNNGSCETDKVRKLSKHKHVAKNLFVWNVFICFQPICIGFNQATLRILE